MVPARGEWSLHDLAYRHAGREAGLAPLSLHIPASARVLETGANAVHVNPALIPRARQPIDRMLAFTAALKNGQPTGALLPHLGAA